MSGLEIVGLISAVISIVEAVEIVYNGIRDTRNLPRAFREVAKKLPLVRDTLRIAERQIGASTDDEACQAVKTVVESCKAKAEELKDIFDAVSTSDNASRFERYRVAVRRLGKGSLVETLAQELMEEVRLLGTNRAVQAATEAQAAELLKAIEELSSMEPSLPDEKSVTQHHSGSGDNVAGNKYQGNHNVYSGSGTAYFGEVTQ